MESNRRKQWIVGSGLFFAVLIVFGAAFYSAGVFLIPLSKQFHWDRAQTSLLFTISALAGAVGTVIAGWLLDRVKVKPVMATGVLITGAALLMASRADSFTSMVVAYAVMGAGVVAGTLLPAIVIITRCWDKGRGTVLGLVISGESAGGMVMVMLASRVMQEYGWRAAYVSLAVPTLAIGLPLVLFLVEDLPKAASAKAHAENDSSAEGVDVWPAIRSPSFWLIGFALVGCTFGLTGEVTHVIPGLIGAGFTAAVAATIWSVALILKSLGQFGFGVVADWIGARKTWALSYEIGAVGVVLLTLSRYSHAAVIPFVILGGTSLGVTIVVSPVVIAECFGLRRFGSIQGVLWIFSQLGSILGPVVVGGIYDYTHSYEIGFLLIAVLFGLSGIAVMSCSPLRTTEVATAPSPAAAKLT